MLTRHTPIQRSPIRRQSKKQARRLRARAKVRVEQVVSGVTVCEFPDCGSPVFDWHHRKKLSRGGSDDVRNRVWLCWAHHEFVETHESFAHAMGLSKKSWETE